MSNLFLTLVIAFVIIVFAIALLAIGWLITGKTRIEKACGRDPTKKKDDNCQSCDMCAALPTQSTQSPQPTKPLNDQQSSPTSHT